MKATPAFVTVSMLLGCSVLLNVVLLTRPRDPEPGPRPAVPGRVESRSVPREEAAALPVLEPTHALESPRKSAALPESASKPVPVPRGASVKDDPAVAAVIDAQRTFKAFWDDLDQLFKAKSRLDDQKVFDSALRTTMDFLELPEGARAAFVETARGGAAAMAVARAEEDAAKKTLPARDKSDPASVAAYEQQKRAIDAQYKERVKAAVDGVRSRLDLQNPRHAEFASNAEKWLKNLIPKQI